MSTFINDLGEIFIHNEVPSVDDEACMDENYSHDAFSSLILEESFYNVDRIIIDYSFFQLSTRDAHVYRHDENYYVYETDDFHSATSCTEDNYMKLSAESSNNLTTSTALVAQVSYVDEDNTHSWIIGSGSTHHMNDFDNEFINMTLEGCDGGVHVSVLRLMVLEHA